MKVGEFILVHLIGPREKFWGILKDRDASGITVRGLSLEGFEGWLHEIARRETVTVLPTVSRSLPSPPKTVTSVPAVTATASSPAPPRTVTSVPPDTVTTSFPSPPKTVIREPLSTSIRSARTLSATRSSVHPVTSAQPSHSPRSRSVTASGLGSSA